jgi:hypothetical protein
VEEPPRAPSQPDPGFVADCRTAVAAWRSAPALPILAVAHQVLLTALGRLSLLQLLLMTSTIGWPGVERAWYQRLYTEQIGIRTAEIPRLLRGYFKRFFKLGVWVCAMMIVPILVLAAVARDSSVGSRIGFIVIAIAVDVGLTFVTPALAVTTASDREATRIGGAMLRATWPACALYALVPPIAVYLFFLGLHDTPSRVAGSAVAALFGLMCKGATLRFYNRREEASDPTWQPVDRSLEG